METRRKTMVGSVVSNKMDKTVVVVVKTLSITHYTRRLSRERLSIRLMMKIMSVG